TNYFCFWVKPKRASVLHIRERSSPGVLSGATPRSDGCFTLNNARAFPGGQVSNSKQEVHLREKNDSPSSSGFGFDWSSFLQFRSKTAAGRSGCCDRP